MADNGTKSVQVERTVITFAPPAGVGTVIFPGTRDDAKNAVNRALTQRAWMEVPSADGAPPLYIGPYALRHVSIIATAFFEIDEKDEEPEARTRPSSPLILPGGVTD